MGGRVLNFPAPNPQVLGCDEEIPQGQTRTQINDLEHKEEINSQPEQNEETGIQKNEERLRNVRTTLNVPISES